MWHLLDSYGRSALGDHLQRRALELHDAALRQLNRGHIDGDRLALADLLTAGAACCRVLDGALDRSQRAVVKASLRRQQHLCDVLGRAPLAVRTLDALERAARGRGEARALQRLRGAGDAGFGGRKRRALLTVVAGHAHWLRRLDGRLPPEAELQEAFVRVYAKAAAALRHPGKRRARRWLGRLVHGEEELLENPADHTHEWRHAAAQRQRLYRLLLEAAALRRLRRRAEADGGSSRSATLRVIARRRAELRAELSACRRAAFAVDPGAYRTDLRWLVFRGLSDLPRPLGAPPRGRSD